MCFAPPFSPTAWTISVGSLNIATSCKSMYSCSAVWTVYVLFIIMNSSTTPGTCSMPQIITHLLINKSIYLIILLIKRKKGRKEVTTPQKEFYALPIFMPRFCRLLLHALACGFQPCAHIQKASSHDVMPP